MRRSQGCQVFLGRTVKEHAMNLETQMRGWGVGRPRRRLRTDWLVPPSVVLATSHILEFDGASLGSPGPAGAGAFLRAPAALGGDILWACSCPLGARTTNYAEYSGSFIGVQAAAHLAEIPATALHCRGDSMLVVRSAEGRWQLNETRLVPLLANLRSAAAALGASVTWEYRPRAENRCADALAGDAASRGSHGGLTSLEWWGPQAAAIVEALAAPAAPATRSRACSRAG